MSLDVVTALSAAIASVLGGWLGIGGALVLTPLLLYGPATVGATAIPVKIVTGLTVVQALAGSLIGLWRHRAYGNVSVPLVRVMGPASAIAALAGAFASSVIADRAILAVFVVVAAVGAWMLFFPPKPRDGLELRRFDVRYAVAIAVAVGFFGGMVGQAGLAFVTAALISLLRVPVRLAIGTSLGIGLFTTAAALIGKAATAQLDVPLALLIVAVAVIATPIGAYASVRTKPRALTTVLALIVVASALRVLWTVAFGV